MPHVTQCSDLDLFGDVIVTVDDVEHWLDTVPHLRHCANHRRIYYAQNWNVINKIKDAKRAGLFQQVINEYEAQHADRRTVAELYNPRYVQ